MITVVTWLWGSKYGAEDVRKLRDGFARHLRQPHRFMLSTNVAGLGEVCETMAIWDDELTHDRGCFARLRMFDPTWQAIAAPGSDRIVCCDLDAIATGQLDPLFDRPEPFVILQGANASNPCPYNGSLMMFALNEGLAPLWRRFSVDYAKSIPFHEFPDDQGWIAYNMPGLPGWRAGPESGVYAFQKPGWVSGDALPADARLVVFPGWRSPAKFAHLPWVQEHW